MGDRLLDIDGNRKVSSAVKTTGLERAVRHSNKEGHEASVPSFKVREYPGFSKAPFRMCFTPEAFEELLLTVGSFPPETGASLFGPKDSLGVDVSEFDRQGSGEGSGAAVYAPDTTWGEERRKFHLSQPDNLMRLWSGICHSHPGCYGMPSEKVGHALGDLGYVEAVFEQNPAMQFFLLPIFTGTGSGQVIVHPWACERGNPVKLFVADLEICDVEEFPERVFNEEWVRTLAKEEVVEPPSVEEPAVAAVAKVEQWKLDLKVLQQHLEGARVEVLADREDLLEVRIRRDGCCLLALLFREFPESPPVILVRDFSAYVQMKPVPWARHSIHSLEKRLARLCDWIMRGFSERF